jgi:hypothetical protein
MNKKGFIITMTTLYYVIIFIIFLSLTTVVVYKSISTDKQMFQSSILYSKFNSGTADDISAVGSTWCTRFFYYDSNKLIDNYNNLDYKIYCEEYHGKRFV